MSGIPAGAGSLLGKRLGKYEILALLALGGTAEIYLARIGGAAGFEKYVVVKCLHDHLADDPEFVKMFLDEARLAACLDHSNIVQTMELGEHENRYFMVMEFLAGLSLAMIVRRAGERLPNGLIPVPLALNIIAQSCAGLHYSHEKMANGKPLNIVHRDISPQNLVISFEGVVKVVDYGIAKAELRETRTRSGTIKGKFAYMSPEQCVAHNVDRRTDVFALGVIAHELLTGRRLFKRPSPYETYQAVLECAVESPSKVNHELDPALDPIIMRACAKDKDGRYPTAEAFGDAILGYLHHRGKGSGPNDVARFFDAHFDQEIQEHGGRMRELISGRDFSVDTGVNWGADDEKGGYETIDITGGAKDDKSLSLTGSDMLDVERPSAASLSDVLGDMDDMPPGDDDDMPAERTRIEQNPLERVKELDQVSMAPRGASGKTPGPVLMNQAHKMPPSGPLPLPAPPTGPLAAAQGEKFPQLANLPTMIAEPDPDTPPPSEAPTALGGKVVDPHRRTDHMDAQNGARPPGAPRPASGGQPRVGSPSTPPRPPGPPGPPMPPQVPAGAIPAGYPVMNAQMKSEMASGATLFPSTRPGGGSGPALGPPPQQHPQHPPPQQHPQQHPQHLQHPQHPQHPQPPHQVPGSGPQPQYPMVPGSGPHDPRRAADLASPVGQHYPQMDWAAAASAPAKAIPHWMLGAIFVGVVGVALLLTFLIVKIAS